MQAPGTLNVQAGSRTSGTPTAEIPTYSRRMRSHCEMLPKRETDQRKGSVVSVVLKKQKKHRRKNHPYSLSNVNDPLLVLGNDARGELAVWVNCAEPQTISEEIENK